MTTTERAEAADVDRLLAAGEQALADGDLRSSRRWFTAAYGAAEAAGDPTSLARAALGLGGLWVHEHRSVEDSTMVRWRLGQALSWIDADTPLAFRLRARLAAEDDYRKGGCATVLTMVEEARRAMDPLVRAETLSLAHHCLLGPRHAVLRAELAEELVVVGARTGRRSDVVMGVLWQTVDLFMAGDPHAHRRLAELRHLVTDQEHKAVGFVTEAIQGMLAVRVGRWDEAERLAGACAERGAMAGDIDATGWYGAQMVAIRWYQGRLVELLPMLRELVDSPTLSAVDNAFLAVYAVASALAGEHRSAVGALARLRGRDLAGLPQSSSWLVTMYAVVEAADLLGDAKTSARAYDLLAPYAHLPMMASLGVACFGSVQHALGVAALTAGRPDRAAAHLAAAIEDNEALGHWPAAAMSRLRHAQALDRLGRPQDLAIARRERVAAAEETARLGLAPLPGDLRPPEPGEGTASCVREGRHWRLALGRRSIVVSHSVGMLHLAVLLANPRTEIPAAELVAGVSGLRELVAAAPESGQPVLDTITIERYRQQIALLTAEIDASTGGRNSARIAELRTEREWLMASVAAGTGLAGRPRHFTDSAERARIAAGKAIRRAIERIARVDAAFGEHLQITVQTGNRCVYHPV